MKIGIPRALLYFWYGNLWERFWSECGWEAQVSPPTDHRIMKSGVNVAIDELCLPVKVFLGHVQFLAPRVDRIFIPHLIKVERDAFICPKFMGLPDLVRHALPGLASKLLVSKVGPKKVDPIMSLIKTALREGVSKAMAHKARKIISKPAKNPALEIAEYYRKKSEVFTGSDLTVGILGHPYCIYDFCLNLNTLERLTGNVRFVTPEMMPDQFKCAGAGRLPKSLFWTMGRLQFDAAEWMLTAKKVDGFIQLVTFACGPEAIVGDLLERKIKEAGKPFLRLYFEEHSGEAGIITRLEAFLDLLKYRSRAC